MGFVRDDHDVVAVGQNRKLVFVGIQTELLNCRKYDPINPDLVPKNACILHAPCYGNLDDIIAKLGYDTNLYKTTKKEPWNA